eukprot:CAMPEP_0174934146 /NCGR_PEP_ID=MMETSP1355-20121228/48449_1 /TAXON_ID=464990 /ORGANISM="Hemiselmis tepida, Strain CCMP443" /LENGTH=112 /DNA_ID=CAMNT_0016180719 /DNA_START=39 /DNA_END=373 /DNA_ORIENTATION=+
MAADMRAVAHFVLRDLWESPLGSSLRSPPPSVSSSFDAPGGCLESSLVQPVTPPTSNTYDSAKIPPMPQKPRSPAKRIKRLAASCSRTPSFEHEDPAIFWTVDGDDEGEAGA